MTKYQTIDTSTLEGLKKAEKLKATGWVTYKVGLYLVYFYKRTPKAA